MSSCELIEFLGPGPSCSCSLLTSSDCGDIFQSGYSDSPLVVILFSSPGEAKVHL